jgi:hypothetical protein
MRPVPPFCLTLPTAHIRPDVLYHVSSQMPPRELLKAQALCAGRSVSSPLPLRLPRPRRCGPPVHVVFAHALVGEGREAVEVPFDTREIQHIEPDLLVVAGVVPLVQCVPGAELRPDGVPNELEELDALLGGALRAPVILVDQRPQVSVEQVLVARRGDEWAAAEIGFEQTVDLRPALGREQTQGRGVLRLRDDGLTRSRLWIDAECSGERPDQVAPADHLAERHLHAAEVVRAVGGEALGEETGHEVKLDAEPRAGLQVVAAEEP